MKARNPAVVILILLFFMPLRVPAEVILQYFNTSWREITEKMPELAEVGYGGLWLPPPTKGSGGLSVGYDCFDPFDLGDKDQRGSVRTRYGTAEELLELVRTAHRFGIRVYFDNIMNHRAFDVPGYDENTPIDLYPGMVPEDFHLRVTEEGFYRKWDNVSDWGDTWQIQYRNFSDLIDIANESPDNGNFGRNEGDHIPKIKFVRHPDHPEYYCYYPSATGAVYVGFGSTNITTEVLTNPANAWLYEEDVNAYLIRAARWLIDYTKCDGLRLDAVKHVPDYFFGQQYGTNKDSSSAGYCGQIQEQFNLTHGYSDWDNHRDSVFNSEQARDDALVFGEHLGEPPSYSGYIDAGMRLVDNTLHGHLNGVLGNPWAGLWGLDSPGANSFGDCGVTYVKSHDDDYASCPELQFAFTLTRKGLPCVYTDGNHQSETLAQSGGAFPRHANTAFLGQFGDNRIPNLVYIHNHFARGDQVAKWSDEDVVAFERRDKRENPSMSDADGTVLFFVMNDNYAEGQYREIPTTFPAGAYLWQYSSGGGNFYYTVPDDQKIKVIVPPGGYFAFSWRSPEESELWSSAGGHPITIYQNGHEAGWVSYVRRDGPDGDPAFNPYGVEDSNTTDYAYTWWVPRVTVGTNLRFVCRSDGSTYNVLMKLDGGINLNTNKHALGDERDNPPALSTDVFLGYEQARFVKRIYPEKFAAVDASRCKIGSGGAETYVTTCGVAGISWNQSVGTNDWDSTYTAAWIYHDPTSTDEWGNLQFDPAPENITNQVTIRVKVGYRLKINRLYIYYTTNGTEWPEGAGGDGRSNTLVQEMSWYADGGYDGTDTATWWQVTISDLSAGTELRYKIGGFKEQGNTNLTPYVDWDVPFPGSAGEVERKLPMMTVFEVTNFNAETIVYYPHNDYGQLSTGLVEGFHVVRARAFLERTGRASIYNTFVQPFYLDTRTPEGEVVYPAENDTLGSREYGVVVRTDPTVVGVWFNIDDADPANDDAQTGYQYGNGTNAAGQTAWAAAYEVTPTLSITSSYPREWRFTYKNIPSGNSAATIRVKLLELSSSTNLDLSDTEGHFTTLTRNVTCDAPSYEMYVAWPQNDGDAVWEGYDLKVWFSKSLADGIDTNTLRDRFLIKIDGVAQGREQYWFEWNVDADHHALGYTLPDLYNGDSNFMHNIEVLHTNAGGGGVTLQASRYARAVPVDNGPHVSIVQPPEYDADGMPYVIELPDVASPDPTQRQYTIRVETDLGADAVWIVFTNCVGYADPVAAVTTRISALVDVAAGSTVVTGVEQQITGTVSVEESNVTVNGSGTVFSNELKVGQTLRISTNLVVVTQIVSDTSLQIQEPYPGPGLTNVDAWIQPAFDSEIQTGDVLLIDSNTVTVSVVNSSSNLTLTGGYPGSTVTNVEAYRITGNPVTEGSRRYWDFLWTNMTEGYFHFVANVDTNGDTNTVEACALRNVTVVFREMVNSDTNDLDDDDDGLYDYNESNPTNLPETNPETWLNGDVHIYYIYGKTDPLSPDSDGDGLPDGLESGWRSPIDTNQTDTSTDTDGDGYPNFISDLDPPFYNTVPDNSGLPNYNFYDSRTKLIHGTMTDPNNADTDYDGLPDGVEDANRNGWVDGDGDPLYPDQDPSTRTNWPDGVWDSAWQETDPNNPDTDGDGLMDGYGEDTNANGRIDGDTNTNRTYEAGEEWSETDPLNPDTDGDGLPDGWEAQYGLDPLDNGTDSFRTATADDGSVINGADGNPDNDFIVQGSVTNPYVNLLEYQNGTNPRIPDTGEPPPEGSIVIGPGEAVGVLDGTTNYQQFMDWTADDCIVLDEYEGVGSNHEGGDIYKAWDGWDESRDIVAFYVRDGGDPGSGGDGKFYFRVDLFDLQAYAEEGNLDIYVVIDIGNPAQGEMNLPDEVDTITSCRWEVVVACYQSSQGRVYIDLDHDNNTTTWGQDLSAYGVISRDQNDADGFVDAYFNSELDSVEFAISRQALLDAGWNGLSATGFNYQVFTTKDGTCNSCDGGNPGPGDIGGRSDVRDAIYNDFIAEDYWVAQDGLDSILKYWIPATTRAGRAKVAVVVHGNQALQPGSVVQDLINDDGAGYFRLLDAHEVYRQPLNLHITPTLAMAMQWAAVDTNGPASRDGPSFNQRIASLVQSNLVYLLASTFSDHMMPYFTSQYNQDNEELARQVLYAIYGWQPRSNTVFWIPEQVVDDDVISKVLDLGYSYALVDQMTHVFYWFGRNEALGDDGYRINRINGLNCFVINDSAADYRFENYDRGLPLALRRLLNRKARSGTQDQVVTLAAWWEEFGTDADADAYDLNLRWLANHPWIRVVSLEQIADGAIDITGDDAGDIWGVVDRGSATRTKVAHNWLHHATEENYDNWYLGSQYEEGLSTSRFEITPGVKVTQEYGMLYTGGIVSQAWDAVNGMSSTGLQRLARAVFHASTFETAFHNQTNEHELLRYSTGDYVYEDTNYMLIAEFARRAQSQSRLAAIYEHVDQWAADADSGYYDGSVIATNADVDLDGEDEFLLFNDRLMAVFGRCGGRIIGVWRRNLFNGDVVQMAGNLVSYPGTSTEEEGAYNVETNGEVVACRTSCLKDWWAVDTNGQGTLQYVNMDFAFTNLGDGWLIVSTDGCVRKTVTLQADGCDLEVTYELTGALSNGTLYVRNGLSPDLWGLLLYGQTYLGAENHTGGVMYLVNTTYYNCAEVSVAYQDGMHAAQFNTAATDDDPANGVDFDTVPMRNQAQTHQVEIFGTGSFSFALGFTVRPADWDGDGMPNSYEDQYTFLSPTNAADAQQDYDGDGMVNVDEYIAGTDPSSAVDFSRLSSLNSSTGIVIRFQAKPRRQYLIWYANDGLVGATWSNATPDPITVQVQQTYEWVDDGSTTEPDPDDPSLRTRFYRLNTRLPE